MILPQQDTVASQDCPVGPVRRSQALIDNLPYTAMIVLGIAVVYMGPLDGTWRWLAAACYGAYGLAGALWIILFICPYCQFYDTRLCPCGYGMVAARLRSRQAGDQFSRQFRKHIPVIIPLWFVPLIAGATSLLHGFAWSMMLVLIAFAVNSFVVLPLVSRKYGCTRCPQKDSCPWMGNCKGPKPHSMP